MRIQWTINVQPRNCKKCKTCKENPEAHPHGPYAEIVGFPGRHRLYLGKFEPNAAWRHDALVQALNKTFPDRKPTKEEAQALLRLVDRAEERLAQTRRG